MLKLVKKLQSVPGMNLRQKKHQNFSDICTPIAGVIMRSKVYICIILLGLTILQGCKNASPESATIEGSFTHLADTWLYIHQLLPTGRPIIDSVQSDASGHFSITIPVKQTGYFSLKRDSKNEIILIAAPGDVLKMSGDGNQMQSSCAFEGSKDSEFYSKYLQFTNENLLKVDSLSQIFTASRTNPDFALVKDKLDAAYLQIFDNQKQSVISFISGHPSSLASLLVISNDFGPNPVLTERENPDLFIKLDSALMTAYPDNSLVNTFHLRILDLKAELSDHMKYDTLITPGKSAPDVQLRNQNGMEVKLTSTRGKLTLVYFWSSWNALSRQTNMNLTRIYKQYHESGFEIYAVSIDSDQELWKKACLLDKAYWIQVNDPKGLGSDYCKTYGVRAIPKMLLISKQGSILSADVSYGNLELLVKRNL